MGDSDGAASTALVLAVTGADSGAIAALATEAARVGVGAIRIRQSNASWQAALAGATGLVVFGPDDGPLELTVGADPLAQLADVVRRLPADSLCVGPGLDALLAGLAAHTHLWLGPGDRPDRDLLLMVARAAALARLAGRPPMDPGRVRRRWPV